VVFGTDPLLGYSRFTQAAVLVIKYISGRRVDGVFFQNVKEPIEV